MWATWKVSKMELWKALQIEFWIFLKGIENEIQNVILTSNEFGFLKLNFW